MKPLLLAGHPALELLNTSMSPHGEPVELIGDGPAFVQWLVDAGILDAAAAALVKRRFDAATLDATAASARKLRAWATQWLARWRAAPDDGYEPELRRLNELLGRAHGYRQLARDGHRLIAVERHRLDSADELIGILAGHLADLVAGEPPELVKRCAGADCTLWFVDRTKAHRRRFCSASACGNREKVAAFRERQRRGDDSTD